MLLKNEAYVADRVDDQLEANSRDFFVRTQNFRHDTIVRRMYLSSILQWYGEDFGANQTEQLRTLSRWLPTEAARQAATAGSVRISYLDYDWRPWSLNERPAGQTTGRSISESGIKRYVESQMRSSARRR